MTVGKTPGSILYREILTYTFFGSILIAICFIVSFTIYGLFKSESRLKSEKVKLLKNQIEFHNKNISALEKEIEKINTI